MAAISKRVPATGTEAISSASVMLVNKSIPSAALARLFEQAARAFHSAGHDKGLFPAQWTALRYFASISDPAHRNATALARYQGVAFGPVSRTIRTLITKGYLAKAGSGGRGRTTQLDLTARGRKLLARDPLQAFADEIDTFAESDKETLAVALERLARAALSRR